MMRAPRLSPSAKLPRLAVLLVTVAGLGLAGCDDQAPRPKLQIGANPVLPEVQQYFMPPMRVAKVIGWETDKHPAVTKGLQIQALATGFQHPRSLYVLPNGDVLVVESKSPDVQPITRPKDIIMGWIESMVTSGGD